MEDVKYTRVAIPNSLHKKVLQIQGEQQAKTGEKMTFPDVINAILIKGVAAYELTEH